MFNYEACTLERTTSSPNGNLKFFEIRLFSSHMSMHLYDERFFS